MIFAKVAIITTAAPKEKNTFMSLFVFSEIVFAITKIYKIKKFVASLKCELINSWSH
jgi:hypothetical protein